MNSAEISKGLERLASEYTEKRGPIIAQAVAHGAIFGSVHFSVANDNVAWLKHLTSMCPINDGELKEVDATQENAAVFVQIIKFICKANRLLTELADVEGLLAYAENINNGPLQIDL